MLCSEESHILLSWNFDEGYVTMKDDYCQHHLLVTVKYGHFKNINSVL